MKRLLILIMIIGGLMTALCGCTEADRVSQNISQEADNFNVLRRLTIINSRTDKAEFELIGAFSIKVDKQDNQLEVTCEIEDGTYKKHFIGLNKETMYVIEDLGGAKVNKYRYEVNFLPEQILPVTVKSED